MFTVSQNTLVDRIVGSIMVSGVVASMTEIVVAGFLYFISLKINE